MFAKAQLIIGIWLFCSLPLLAEKITYDDHVRSIFKADCSECHNANKAKGGLNLSTYAQAMEGSSAGPILESSSVDNSVLFECITSNDSDIRMPPKGARMSKADVKMIKQWILGGLLENRSSSKKKIFVKNDAFKAETKKGEVIIPEQLSLLPWHYYKQAGPIKNLVKSPFSPLMALSMYKQIALYNSETLTLIGYLDFPEGTINDLSFSEDGRYLLAAGGHVGNEGMAVIWDIKTGRRIFQLEHKDMDIHVAHMSPDMKLLALGSNDKKVKIFSMQNKQILLEEKAHSEWVSALRFSPDGKFLVSGDRNGQIIVWDSKELSMLHTLYKHKGMINALAWRPDSKVFVSASEDSSILFFDPIKGNELKSIKSHKNGVSSLFYDQKGQLCSTGNDKTVRVFDSNYKQVRSQVFTKSAPLLNALMNDEHILATNYKGNILLKRNDEKEIEFISIQPQNLKKLKETKKAHASISIEVEQLNKKRHLEMLKQFNLSEDIQQLKLEQLYLLDEIEEAVKMKLDPISKNRLYTKNAQFFKESKKINDLIMESQKKQLQLKDAMEKTKSTVLNVSK
ncbi:hypothetical protein PQO03_06170 [Lentisphaera profundi]|uniref:Cytochrome c domain-containing protein n=1 Tax=Lentisphaera profundi TaxID=1658616 RepID=A0ABY7VR87_9BACT|nr:c-type cytochrome domain-containing protein [Lentisphaera profundi]WDE95304.1 hypothetical protein PQO03_06170 [Lentisphaera profundi]